MKQLNNRCIAVITTVDSKDKAEQMAYALVQQKLAACAQISEIESIYHWDGSIVREKEYRVLFKTTFERYSEVEAAIRSLHTYELPAIHALALDPIYPPYEEWIAENTKHP